MSVKKRISMSRDTFYDRQFRRMSKDAQLGYIQLLFNAEVSGLVFSPEDVIGVYGIESIDELLENGFLLEVNGHVYIARNWIENKFESRWVTKLEECDDYVSGDLDFEGEVGRSKYVLTKSCQKFDKSLSPKGKGNNKGNDKGKGKGNSNDKCNINININRNATFAQISERDAEGDDAHVACQCPKCGRRISMRQGERGVSAARCDDCGIEWVYDKTWLMPDADSGELVPFLDKSA